MKIEIEFEEVDRMKREIAELKARNLELHSQLSELDKDKLEEKAVILSMKMFENVMGRVFEELGFKDRTCVDDINFIKLKRNLGSNWWESLKLEVKIGASITNKFRVAFIGLGIIHEDITKS